MAHNAIIILTMPIAIKVIPRTVMNLNMAKFPLTKILFRGIMTTWERVRAPLHRGYFLKRFSKKQPNAVSSMPTIKSIKPFNNASRMLSFGFG